jgi:hypothetical protein
MTIARLASLCARGPAGCIALGATLALAACASSSPSVSPGPPSGSAAPAASATPAQTPRPTPTPEPTLRYTNPPDPGLAALIPTSAAGATIVVPPITEFSQTPGDIGGVYGEVGVRFSALAIGYVTTPRTSLYAMRVDGGPVATADLEPYLAAAGNYVGIAGLHREPWSLAAVDPGHMAWVRAEDNATVAGTMIYTWAADEYVFLLIGVDDAVNRAIVAALPGEPQPTPTPAPSRTPRSSATPTPSG